MLGKTILVLDENDASRHFLSNTLREKQFKVLEAGSGKEALIVAWRDEPDVILFDPILSDLKSEEFVQKLRQNARTSNTPIIALSSDPDPILKEACLNAGVTEYLGKSSEAIHALESVFSKIFGVETLADMAGKEEKEAGLLIVFLSAKGGTGTSSLCANLAMNIKQAQPEMRLVVADLVLPIGSIEQIVGHQGTLNLVTVADLPSSQTNVDFFHQNLPELESWKFQLLAGSPDPQHGNMLEGDRVGEIVDTLRAAFDIVILDLGRSLSRISLPLIQQADLIALIVSTDQSTVKLTKTVWEYLQAQGIDPQSVYAILNRAMGVEGSTKSEAEEIIGLTIQTALPYMGGNFSLANNLNQPTTTKYPTDAVSLIFKQTAEDMIKLARRQRTR